MNRWMANILGFEDKKSKGHQLNIASFAGWPLAAGLNSLELNFPGLWNEECRIFLVKQVSIIDSTRISPYE